ncbi:hypothetical protein EC973_007015 [Apophysomyces ossiformis]|uniref:Uncharacterized protein n=1 Tax=Apophysomyces ossiformis TaxID=679940 RepID=A0A8H7EQ15_9FUNG|nr:hypothetical protein EC973_007015 [Apophysomyces ossiformis]
MKHSKTVAVKTPRRIRHASPSFVLEEELAPVHLLPDGSQLAMALNPNRDMSCYIDAPFEMLMSAIFPYFTQVFSHFDEENMFDKALYDAYVLYAKNDDNSRIDASNTFRQFIWERTQFKRTMSDVVEFVEDLFSKTSIPFQSLFATQSRKRKSCKLYALITVC